MAGEWIDVSVPITSGMVHWPGDPPVELSLSGAMAKGDPANVTHLDMGAHTGTHMDAPVHWFEGREGIDALPLEIAIGPARVIEISDPVAAGAKELAKHDPRPGERLLLRSRNSRRRWENQDFDEGFVYIAADGAELLAERGVALVGVDYLSVGGFSHDAAETHRALLGGGVWIIEGLELTQVEPGDYELICLPLKIVGSDGGPARAALRLL